MRKYIFLAFLFTAVVISVSAESLNALLYSAKHGSSDAMNQLGAMYYTGNGAERNFDAAHYWWSRGAIMGNPKAMANLGVCYQFGRGARCDSVEAMRLYISAIAAGQTELLKQRSNNVASNPFDAMLTATCQLKGVGTEADPVKAIESFTAAANLGSIDGMRGAGETYLALGDRNKALEYLKKAADKSDDRAAYLAGDIMIKSGSGTDKGIAYLRRAAENGNTSAQDALGQALIKGGGVRQNTSEGLSWLRKSAQGGCAKGMWDYANALLDSDFDSALFWFGEAAQAGYMDEFKQLANSLNGSSDFRNYLEGMRLYLVNGDYDKASAFFKKVEKNRKEGRLMKAIVMADEANPEANPKKAVAELQKLASAYPKAAVVLSQLYAEGRGVKKSYSKALSTLRSAANNGYGPAQDALASLYFTEEGPSYYRQAAELYTKAEHQRALSAKGKENLKQIYSSNFPVEPETYNALIDYRPSDEHVKALLSGKID